MKEITVEEFETIKKRGDDIQLIDVREPYEFDMGNLGGELIPLGQIPLSLSRICRDKKVILYCKTGSRSANIALWLEQKHGFDNLYSLKGGLVGWAQKMDPALAEIFS